MMKNPAKSKNLSFLLASIFFPIQFLFSLAFSVQGQSTDSNPFLNNELKFERLTVENGLSSNYVRTLLQDRKGFMWFATQEGLQKFDGYTTTLYQNDPNDSNSLSHNNVSFVYEDKAGLLWVSTAEGGVNKFDPQLGKWQRYLHDPKNPNSPAKGGVHAFFEDQYGIIWIGAWGGGLTRLDPKTDQFTRYTSNPKDPGSLKGDYIASIIEDRAGKFWVATDQGLHLLDRKTNQFRYFSLKEADAAISDSWLVHHLFEDKEGLLWLSTDQGVYVIEPKAEKVLNHYFHDPAQPNSLTINAVLAVTEDFEGNFWITTRDGLNRFNPGTGEFTPFQDERNFARNLEVHAIMVDNKGLVWLSTHGGGVFFFSIHPTIFRRLRRIL
jgi:ligand-binding sensor domain-containing protein